MNLLTGNTELASLTSMAMFIVVSTITPGPNNVMLTASGANFGYLRSVPHMLGISVGGAAMLLLVGAGLGTLFEQIPQLYVLLQMVGAVYLLWLAWKIANSGHVQTTQSRINPLNFLQAAAFQWVNPKAWILSIGVVAVYTNPNNYWPSLLLGGGTMLLVSYPCISVWTLFGALIGRWLQSSRALQLFNWGMAGLLVLSLWPLLAAHM